MLDFATNFLEVRPLLKRAGCLKEAVSDGIESLHEMSGYRGSQLATQTGQAPVSEEHSQ
jgi:hypothetical protein